MMMMMVMVMMTMMIVMMEEEEEEEDLYNILNTVSCFKALYADNTRKHAIITNHNITTT